MRPTSKTMSLLVVRNLSMFSQIWHEMYEFLVFKRKQIPPQNMNVKMDILGVFVEPSLLLPDTLCLIHSFGLSDVWSLCEIYSNLDERADRDQQLYFLIKTLLHERSGKPMDEDNSGQVFFPAFKEGVASQITSKRLKVIEKKYSGLIKKRLIFNDKTEFFRFEKL